MCPTLCGFMVNAYNLILLEIYFYLFFFFATVSSLVENFSTFMSQSNILELFLVPTGNDDEIKKLKIHIIWFHVAIHHRSWHHT